MFKLSFAYDIVNVSKSNTAEHTSLPQTQTQP